jgi:hypothetical protein
VSERKAYFEADSFVQGMRNFAGVVARPAFVLISVSSLCFSFASGAEARAVAENRLSLGGPCCAEGMALQKRRS